MSKKDFYIEQLEGWLKEAQATCKALGETAANFAQQTVDLEAANARLKSDADEWRHLSAENKAAGMDWMERADEAEAALAAEREKHRWIPVGERLPEMGDFVMVWFDVDDGNGARGVMTYRGDDDMWGDNYANKHVTHWRPLPEPPEEEK